MNPDVHPSGIGMWESSCYSSIQQGGGACAVHIILISTFPPLGNGPWRAGMEAPTWLWAGRGGREEQQSSGSITTSHEQPGVAVAPLGHHHSSGISSPTTCSRAGESC